MRRRQDNTKSWLKKANHDLLNISNNLVAKKVPWDTICFHAQQAGEKILKAYLVNHKKSVPRTHDLIHLLEKCITIDKSLEKLEDACRQLTQYAVTSRYPNDLYEPDKNDGMRMIKLTKIIRKEIQSRLKIK